MRGWRWRTYRRRGQLRFVGVVFGSSLRRASDTAFVRIKMLAADKQALQAVLQQNSLKLREKELEYFTSNFGSIATQSALLAGFSFTALNITYPEDHSQFLRVLYFTSTTMAMGCALLAVCNSTFCVMFGPGLALRGPEGSMHRAVEGMAQERATTFAFFGLGLVCFHISGLLLSWLVMNTLDASFVTVILISFLFLFFYYGRRIYRKFQISDGAVQTGAVQIGGELIGGAGATSMRAM